MEGQRENQPTSQEEVPKSNYQTDQKNKNTIEEAGTERQKPLNKYKSEPKLQNYKEQILKIPKVKQILNMNKYVYSQDIEKRLELIGSLKNDQYAQKQMVNLHDLRKPVEKKMRRHKTNFKIPLTRKNMQSLNELVVDHIKQNQRYKNEEVVFLKSYQQTAPFDLDKLNFMDEIDKVKKKYKQKYPGLNAKVLSRNKLTLQNVILNRNIKREMKLDKKKSQKQHAKNVMNKLQSHKT